MKSHNCKRIYTFKRSLLSAILSLKDKKSFKTKINSSSHNLFSSYFTILFFTTFIWLILSTSRKLHSRTVWFVFPKNLLSKSSMRNLLNQSGMWFKGLLTSCRKGDFSKLPLNVCRKFFWQNFLMSMRLKSWTLSNNALLCLQNVLTKITWINLLLQNWLCAIISS